MSGARKTQVDRKNPAGALRPAGNRLLLAGAAVVILLLAAGAIILWSRAQARPVAAVQASEDPALGPPQAPVTIVEYGDFGCPTCRAWHNTGTLNQIRAKYGDKVRFVWRDFPVITAQSPKAAEAARCANDQGKFWPYHDLLYARQPALSVKDLKSYAAEQGLNTTAFNQCMDSSKYAATVEREKQDAFARGFRGTPSFLVNDKPLPGPPNAAYLEQLIDSLLAAAK